MAGLAHPVRYPISGTENSRVPGLDEAFFGPSRVQDFRDALLGRSTGKSASRLFPVCSPIRPDEEALDGSYAAPTPEPSSVGTGTM